MGVLTEIELREKLKREGRVDTISVDPGTIITPAAAQYLREQGIKLVFADQKQVAHSKEPETPKKPEHYTHLDKERLVPKTHPRIRLRGMLDLLQALIIKAQLVAQKEGLFELVGHLEQMLSYVRQLLRSEVLGEEAPRLRLFGLDEDDIHEFSHHPFKYLGINHLTPSYHMGPVIAELNYLRAFIREVELVACDAYLHEDGTVERLDLIRALNRLSSAAYVMECKFVAGHYHVSEGSGAGWKKEQ